jgi:hypothetical protein
METIKEAKDFLRGNWEKGVDCPCCKQFVKKYSRKLTTSMSVGLISLYVKSKQNIGQSVHIKDIEMVNGGEFAQLKRWRLIQDEVNDDEKKRTSGMWNITQKGINFVENRITVPKYCDTYNGKTLGFSEEMTSIKQSLPDNFNYAELMNS